MRVRTRVFWLPKGGNATDDYEDAFWPPETEDQEASMFRVAVADGATETSFSGLWAQLLVRGWCSGRGNDRRVWRALPRLQRTWLATVSGRPLPWYAEEKLRSGAFASLLGLHLGNGPGPEGRWLALAVGDSCVLHVRGPALLAAFPLSHSSEFNSRPHLVSSNPGSNAWLSRETRRLSGAWRDGDTFLLATDALACGLLRAAEEETPWWGCLDELFRAGDNQAFGAWVDGLRAGGLIRNDDVTLLRVDVNG